MIDFVDLMEGRSASHNSEESMEQLWYADNWILEPTYQGKRSQCLISNGEVSFRGKRKAYKDAFDINSKIPHIISDINSLSLPSGTLLDGYFAFDNDDTILLYKFLSFKEISDIQEMYQQHGLIKFYITDLINLKEEPLFSFPLFDRKKKLSEIITDKENVKLQTYYLANKFEVYNTLSNKFKMFIFKKIDSIYKFGISSDWMIYKIPKSYYMIIIGFIENDKEEFRNMVLALTGAQIKYGRQEAIMSVPVHGSENRLSLFQKKTELRGQVFEIKALEKKSGKYQEARFFCLRPDLKPENCVFEEEE